MKEVLQKYLDDEEDLKDLHLSARQAPTAIKCRSITRQLSLALKLPVSACELLIKLGNVIRKVNVHGG